MARDSLGELEQLLMLAVARLGEEAYGAGLQRLVHETAGREIAIATIYVTLVRLEKKGYVRSRLEDPTPVRGGKAKRSFLVTARGVRALKEARALSERMWKGLENLAEFRSR